MKLKRLICIACSTLFLSQFALGTTKAYVLCGKRDATQWNWVMDTEDPSQYLILEGYWEVGTTFIDQKDYQYPAFQISREKYKQLAAQCEEDYAPQPHDGYASEWALFHIMESNGLITRATGVFDSLAAPGEQSYRFVW